MVKIPQKIIISIITVINLGFIFIEFPGTGRAALPFAMMLQMSIKRSQIKVNLDKFKKNIQDDRTLEWELLPLMDGEKPIDWIRGILYLNSRNYLL